jgi:poly(hydroxyalkanoate) depolymerase family esterase
MTEHPPPAPRDEPPLPPKWRARLREGCRRLWQRARANMSRGLARIEWDQPPDPAAIGQFTEAWFGTDSPRRYMLYQPASRWRGHSPLLVMLHGCQQGASEFATATRMNEAAEEAGMFVLYPEQSVAANVSRCWNWYGTPDHWHSGADAPLLAAMTLQVLREHDLDAARVYVAGMSAGGGMAAVLARHHPQLYAALGVHSGVPAGLAHDVFSALRLMARGPARSASEAAVHGTDREAEPAALPTIVFHGDEDTTVHPTNGEAIHPTRPGGNGNGNGNGNARTATRWVRTTTPPSGLQRGFTRTVELDRGRTTRSELWIIHGAGHAWAGGSEAQRHTDPGGPDASREMLRFFLQHRRVG